MGSFESEKSLEQSQKFNRLLSSSILLDYIISGTGSNKKLKHNSVLCVVMLVSVLFVTPNKI